MAIYNIAIIIYQSINVRASYRKGLPHLDYTTLVLCMLFAEEAIPHTNTISKHLACTYTLTVTIM